jgi:hypothetical protein
MGFSKFAVKMSLLLTGPLDNVTITKNVRPRQTMADAIIDGAYEGNLPTMDAHVLLVAARDIHHCGGLGGLIALVAIRVCGYQLLRRNKQGDFESNCSGVIGGTDEQLFAPPIYLAHTKTAALRMVFKTVWEAQANLPQEFRSVTSVQLLKAANEKYNFATPPSRHPISPTP